ncbi:MAG: hypothetical protein WCF63_07490 [Acidimicrobiales bacterium]
MSADQREPTILEREWSEWRRERERQLSDPHCLLAAKGCTG